MQVLALIPKKYYLYGLIILIVSAMVLTMGIFTALFSDTDDNAGTNDEMISDGTQQLSPLVEAYRGEVEAEARADGIPQYVDLILALMMQESGGQGPDPMQSSESLCGYIGCITSPIASIVQGVKHFKEVMKEANYDVMLGLQSYNFGGGFIQYAKEHNGGKYSKELAIQFSQMMYSKLASTGLYKCHRPEAISTGACFGDIGYVDAVLKYYHPQSVSALNGIPVGGGTTIVNAQGKLKALLTEAYKYKGLPYVLGGNNPQQGFDCSSLVQWSFRSIGINLPRTANDQYKASRKISESDLKPGDLIFFTGTYNAGVPVTHVGIYIGNNKMYNANDSGVGESDLNNPYWQSHLYGYGRVADF